MQEIFQGADTLTLRNNIREGLMGIKREMLMDYTVELSINNAPGLEGESVLYFRPNLPADICNLRDTKNLYRKEKRLKNLQKQFDEEAKDIEIYREQKEQERKNKLKYKKDRTKIQNEESIRLRLEKQSKLKLEKSNDKEYFKELREKRKQDSINAKLLAKEWNSKYKILDEKSN